MVLKRYLEPHHLFRRHSELAVKSALEMRNKLVSLNQHWELTDDTPLKHGIGIHTGEVVAGNVGPPSRLSYKMIGDTVNLAARIQELTKTFNSDILISGDAYQSVNTQFDAQYFGKVTVRGKKIEQDIYGIM